jgi:hypothetical protein
MTIQYLQGLNLFVIMELTIATLFAGGVRYEASDFGFFAFPAHSLVAS